MTLEAFAAGESAAIVALRQALDPEDPIFAWRERMLGLHGGLARAARGYPVWA